MSVSVECAGSKGLMQFDVIYPDPSRIARHFFVVFGRRRFRVSGISDVLRMGRIVFDVLPEHLDIRPEVFELASDNPAPARRIYLRMGFGGITIKAVPSGAY